MKHSMKQNFPTSAQNHTGFCRFSYYFWGFSLQLYRKR